MSYVERQEDEVEFLCAVFPGDCQDLRVNDKWKVDRPAEFMLTLVPQKSMGGSALNKRPLSVKLHTKYTTDYPDSAPLLSLEDSYGLSPDQVKELQDTINKMAADRVGEVMMLDIAQTVQEFLHRHEGPQVSLYEEMLLRQHEREKVERMAMEAEREATRIREEEEHQRIAEEIEQRKAELQLSDNDSEVSVENSRSSPPPVMDSPRASTPQRARGPPTPVKTAKPEREQIHKGRLLGDSVSGGCSVFVGMSSGPGDLLAVYEWTLQCRAVRRSESKRIKQVASIQMEFDNFQSRGIQHPNLVQYLGMSHVYSESTNQITVEVVMEYVGGGSVCSWLRNPDCGPIKGETHRHYSKQLLEALSYLHGQGIVHNDLRPSLVFFETGGSIKLGGHGIVKRLSDLAKAMTMPRPLSTEVQGVWSMGGGGKKGDVLRLGILLLCMAAGRLDVGYPPTIPHDLSDSLKDFLLKCTDSNEQLRFPAYELLHHPYILPALHSSHTFTTSTPRDTHLTTAVAANPLPTEMRFQRSDSIVGSPTRACYLGRSRLETEFEELENLGSGGFGDVFKVRNHLDGRLYALKKIVMRSDSRMMTRITREVEMLSQMNHENVVRYYNAWIETFSEEQFKKNSGVDLSIQSDLSFSGSGDETSESCDSDLESEEELSGHDSTGDSEVVFMEGFSDSSGEGANVLDDLESQVMKATPFRLRLSTNESSDTVIFAESSLAMGGVSFTHPIPIKKSDKRREKRKESSNGEVQILYIQMEYCENETLRQLIDAGQLHSDKGLVWRLFRELVEGLEHIHSKGMIHRDLKPGNIFLNSSGHIKVGDFGLATSHKSSGHRNNANTFLDISEMTQGETGLVGTAMYLSPEMLRPIVKYSQKVDIYSLGIIFFEMCHAPLATAMERHKVLVALRRREIVIPDSMDRDEMEKQIEVIRWLLSHNPHDRPTSKQLLQSPLLPLKMEDEELQEVLLRTLQAPNSTRYKHMIDELFTQERSLAQEYSYFMDPPDAKRGSQPTKKNKFSFFYTLLQKTVNSRLESIFARHGATPLTPPLLAPLRGGLYDKTCRPSQFIDRSGRLVHLPPNLRVPFARFVVQQGISYLKRYSIACVYRESRVLGFHPREHIECQFDIVSPSQDSLVPDAEVMCVVSEVISELPGLQEVQYNLVIGHTSLLASILSHCSIPVERHHELWPLLHKVTSGSEKFSELEKLLKDKQIPLSPLASKTLQRWLGCEVAIDSEERVSLLEPLSRDKSPGVRSKFSEAWQEVTTVVDQLRQFGAKDNVLVSPGLCPSHYSHFSGLVFQVMETLSGSRKNKRRVPLATGGRYNRLLNEFRSSGKQSVRPSVSVVGVSIAWDILMTRALGAYQHGALPSLTKCSVLVCWLGRESLQRECSQLVRDLWTQGIAADLLYESLELDNVEDIQDFCRRQFIQHIVLLTDRTLYFERKQVKVRSLESGKVTERLLTTSELGDYLSQRQASLERADSIELRESARSLSSSDSQSNLLPPINVNIVATGKLTGHMKRRYHDQAVSKLIPLIQTFSSKQPLEVLAVDLKTEHLSLLAAESNKLMGSNEQDFSPVVKSICERYADISKKYIIRVCESIKELLKGRRKAPMLFLYSHSAEICQIVLNNLDSLSSS
ncbi:eIF-2-alpha kinase GCN2-like isoform X2 [Halichondria panicea]|uniref:eIF-2-alpha kinase GCN2-like isoform X2 n=1 Tax=Halichondria panicea TaxID=6063 RepID=UPI00312B7CAE